MSAAQMESESMTGWSPAKKERKRREAGNRIVTNLAPPVTWWVRNEATRLDLPPAQMVRVLVMEGLKARGLSEARIKAMFLQEQIAEALAEVETEDEAESVG